MSKAFTAFNLASVPALLSDLKPAEEPDPAQVGCKGSFSLREVRDLQTLTVFPCKGKKTVHFKSFQAVQTFMSGFSGSS